VFPDADRIAAGIIGSLGGVRYSSERVLKIREESPALGIPAIYEAGGREYLAVCVGAGAGMMATHVGGDGPASQPGAGAYMILALPKK